MSEISYQKPVNPRWKDLSGQKFGRLTVESFRHIARSGNQSRSYWNCICECGNKAIIQSNNLVKGIASSCGCYQRERTSKANTKHGLSSHPIYHRLMSEVQRCYNQNHVSFHNYGGRGIRIYQPWLDNIGLMVRDVERLIGLPPTKYHQLDRDNNNKGYQPDNICWKTPEENARNKRNTHNHAKDPVTKEKTSTYRAWQKLLQRHGDEVCTEWKDDKDCETTNGFRQFLADMGEKPPLNGRKRAPLKRYDETKPWCRENCYWS